MIFRHTNPSKEGSPIARVNPMTTAAIASMPLLPWALFLFLPEITIKAWPPFKWLVRRYEPEPGNLKKER